MKTLSERIFDAHQVAGPEKAGFPSVLYIDLHLIHEVTSPQAFAELEARGLGVRRPERTFATVDHSIPTSRLNVIAADAQAQVERLEQSAHRFGIRLFDPSSGRQGIVHVIGPELGLTQPGMTIVCGDSHTSTHGAFGALSFGIGTSQVAHVLATQTMLMKRPRPLSVRFEGRFPRGVTAKDAILALIAKIGVNGGTGCVLEYSGEAIRGLDMEARMTICNMSIEAGARAGMIAPDDVTFEYLAGRELAPRGAEWDRLLSEWRTLRSDEDARFERTVEIDVSRLQPMVTFGTNPEMAIGVTEPVPSPDEVPLPKREGLRSALDYMKLDAGRPLVGKPIDVVFIGSCTNGRISDLRSAAQIFEGRRVASGVRALVVPGSQAVKRQAEAEGLDLIFREAGAEWREPGCSMCIAMNGDQLEPGQYAVSTSNRNFEGRQGPGGRTILASPATAAAAAVTGRITDVRTMLGGEATWNRSLA